MLRRFHSFLLILLSASLIILVGCGGGDKGNLPQRSNPATTGRNNAPPFGTYALEQLSQGVRVYIKVTDEVIFRSEGLRIFSQRYRVGYRYFKSFNANAPELADSVSYEDILLIDGQEPVIAFNIAREMPRPGVLELSFLEKVNGVKTILEIPLRKMGNGFAENFQFYKSGSTVPLFQNYVHVNDTFNIMSLTQPSTRLFVTYYSFHFRPALPPMAVEPMPGNTGFKVDSVFTVLTGEPLNVSRPGLYLFQKDTLHEDGKTIRVGDVRYPKPMRAETLIDPLIYITTSDERRRLVTADDPKRELDRFWIYLAGNKDFARNMIRSYYTKVTEANELFTTYKEGWKTDKGMIFIIFGRPDSIRRGDDREVWVYERKGDLPPVNFVFQYLPNLFSPANYELVRDVNYDDIWFEKVERWRKGTQLN